MTEAGAESTQVPLSAASDPERAADALEIQEEARQFLRDEYDASLLGLPTRLTGVTTPRLAASQAERNPFDDDARARLEWAKRTYEAALLDLARQVVDDRQLLREVRRELSAGGTDDD